MKNGVLVGYVAGVSLTSAALYWRFDATFVMWLQFVGGFLGSLAVLWCLGVAVRSKA